MKFIKRFIFFVLVFLLAFFVYRLISPTSAKNFLNDIQSFANDTLGTHFSVHSGAVFTGTTFDATWLFLENTWIIQPISGDEELLLNDVSLPSENFDVLTGSSPSIVDSWAVILTSSLAPSLPVVQPTPTLSPVAPKQILPKKTTTTTSTKPQGQSDISKLLENFSN